MRPTKVRPRRCQECPAKVSGKDHLCARCRDKRLRCRTCSKPHGGPPATTKYCPPCRAARRGRPPKYRRWTPAEDKILREVYGRLHARAAMAELRQRFADRPTWSIKRRAQALGAATVGTREPPWSPEEDKLLAEIGWMMPERIVTVFRQRGLKRTLTAIAVRRKRLRLRSTIDGLTAQGLAGMLGVDIKTVTRWITIGDLEAERAGTRRDNNDYFHITTAQIRAFFFRFPERIVLSKLERVGSKMWFLELLTGGQIAEHGTATADPGAGPPPPERTVPLYGEQVTLSALADISGRSVGVLVARLDQEGRSVEDAAFGVEGADIDASPMLPALAAGLRTIMARHRARPAHVAGWTGLPLPLVDRCLAGSIPIQAPAMQRVIETLDAEVTVVVTPKKHDWG